MNNKPSENQVGTLSRHGLHIYSTESQLPIASVIRHRSKFISAQQDEINTRLAVREEALIALFVASPLLASVLDAAEYISESRETVTEQDWANLRERITLARVALKGGAR